MSVESRKDASSSVSVSAGMSNTDGVFSYDEEEQECNPGLSGVGVANGQQQFDDDHNNNYILDNSAEDEEEEDYDNDDDDYYNDNNHHHFHSHDGHDDDEDDEEREKAHRESLDPEFFDYESYPLEKLDWIVEKKCEQLVSYLKLEEPLDALVLLRQFEWNHQTVMEAYDKDKKKFTQDYLYTGDSNNNNSKKFDSLQDRIKLASYLNIFGDASNTLLNSLSEKIKRMDENETTSSSSNNNSSLCSICYTSENGLASLAQCSSHMFCIDCWAMHFESLIRQGGGGGTCSFECMQTKCNSLASRDFVIKCLQAAASLDKKGHLIEKYKRLIAMDLIRESNDIQMCPGEERLPMSQQQQAGFPNPANSTPTTRNAFKLVTTIAKNTGSPVTTITTISRPTTSNDDKLKINPLSSSSTSSMSSSGRNKCHFIVWIKSKPAARRVFCSHCEFQYCFMCGLPYHAPNSCSVIRSWNVKCQDDSETRNYLLVHTQDCPKCKVCIEKNGGCSHMTCNRCKHEFCWVCGNDWKTHGATYDCNRYKGNPDKDTAREALNRYTHYYHRWINHANSLKFERALKEQSLLKIQEKIMNRAGGGTLVDWEFLIEAVDVLTRARYTLQYTYPFAYFLDSNEDKALFENIQAELEREVENLSHSLEKVNLNDKFNIKLQMDILEKRRKTLLKDFIRS